MTRTTRRESQMRLHLQSKAAVELSKETKASLIAALSDLLVDVATKRQRKGTFDAVETHE